jgi:hypothetical protein
MSLLSKIEKMALLAPNWNGNNASPLPPEVIERAKCLAPLLEGCGFEVFPTAQDSIQFEKTMNGEYLEIEVFADRLEAFQSSEESSLC